MFSADKVRDITCLEKAVFFAHHEWRKWTEFVSKAVYLRLKPRCWCRRLMGMRVWTDQTFLGGVSVSGRQGAGRWERWPSKIDSNWGKHCCCCWFSKKWPLNHTKNDRIFEHAQDYFDQLVSAVEIFFLLHNNAHAHSAASFASL
jgi:hypothetical protein